MLWTGFVRVKLIFVANLSRPFYVLKHEKGRGMPGAQSSQRENQSAMYGVFQNKTKI